jgi:hypothetical protein
MFIRFFTSPSSNLKEFENVLCLKQSIMIGRFAEQIPKYSRTKRTNQTLKKLSESITT